MAPRQMAVVVPTTAALRHSVKLRPGDQNVLKALSRLPRLALLTVILDWLDEKNQPLCRPYLADDADADKEDDEEEDEEGEASTGFAPAASVEELVETYQSLRQLKGSRREVVDRVVYGDWRRGLNLYQMATIDLGYLLARPASQKWVALKLCRVVASSGEDRDITEKVEDLTATELPRFHAPTFLRNLQREISPVAKAHYYLARVEGLPLTVLRIRLQDTPYDKNIARQGGWRVRLTADDGSTVFIGFPDGTPMIYVTIPSKQFGEARSLRKVVLDTSLSARQLQALLFLRGPGRGAAAAGGWGIFIEGSVEGNPLGFSSFKSASMGWADLNEDEEGNVHEVEDEGDGRTSKRRKMIAQGRFGNSGIETDGKGIELLDVRIEDPFSGIPGASNSLPINIDEDAPSASPERQGDGDNTEGQSRDKRWDSLFGSEPPLNLQTWRPDVRLTFQGTHIFAGARKLVDSGAVDGASMPGWMTGEAGVSGGAVRDGIIKSKERKL
ncbi:MAG: hypothetical protein M1839_007893 [Geoglossum umbratile]|nr:MAG: hypothetical protein M1839_007893 [Geoglossum umbratile]